MASQRTSARALARVQLQTQALEMRMRGYGYNEIGIALGKSTARAHQIVSAALSEFNRRRDRLAEEETRVQLAQTNALLKRHFPLAGVNGDTEHTDRVLKLLDRRARLTGAYAPEKFAPTLPNGEPIPPPAASDNDEPVRYVYFLPQPAATEEEWKARRQLPSPPAASSAPPSN